MYTQKDGKVQEDCRRTIVLQKSWLHRFEFLRVETVLSAAQVSFVKISRTEANRRKSLQVARGYGMVSQWCDRRHLAQEVGPRSCGDYSVTVTIS